MPDIEVTPEMEEFLANQRNLNVFCNGPNSKWIPVPDMRVKSFQS